MNMINKMNGIFIHIISTEAVSFLLVISTEAVRRSGEISNNNFYKYFVFLEKILIFAVSN